MRPALLPVLIASLVLILLPIDPAAAANTTTPAPDSTPAPAAGMPVRLSFLIDGVVYVMQCNLTGLNMSNCSFATDHGLTVTPLSSSPSGLTEIPVYIVVMLGFTLALVAVLVGMAAYLVWSRNTGRTAGGYAAPPEQYQPEGLPPGQYPQQPGFDPRYYGGQASNAGGRPKIINVNLVQPSLPPETSLP